MTQSELIHKFSNLSCGFSIEERVSLNNVLELFHTAEEKVLGWVGETPNNGPVSTILPKDLSLGDQIGLDYLQFTPATDDEPRQLFFGLSWQNAGWELFPGIFSIEEFDLQFIIFGSNVTVVIEGFATLEDFQLAISMELPSFMVRARLSNQDEPAPSPASLVNRFTTFLGASSEPVQGIQLQDFSLVANPFGKNFFLNLEFGNLVIGQVVMDGQVQVNYNDGATAGFCWADFAFTAGGVDYLIGLKVAHESPGSGWQFEGGAAFDGLNLLDLFNGLKTKFGTGTSALPDSLSGSSAEVKSVFLSFNTQSKAFTFSCSLDFHELFSLNQPSSGDDVALNLEFNFSPYEENGVEKHHLTFSGQIIFRIGGHEAAQPPKAPLELEFDLVFDKGGDGRTLVAAYKDLGGGEIHIKDLIKLFTNADVSDLDFEIDLKQAYFISNKTSTGSHKFILGLDIGGGIDLSKLPLVGQLVPSAQRLSINLQPLYASSAFAADELGRIQGLVPGDLLALPEEIKAKGADITIALNLGDQPLRFEIPISVDDVNTKTPAAVGGVATTDAAPSPSPAAENSSDDGTHWFNLQKSLGPVSFQRLGVKYQDKKFWFKIDGALTAAGLTLSLEGLAVGVELPHVTSPSFDLRGLGLDFKKGEFEIGGSFLRIPGIPGQTEDEYDGMAVMKYKQLGLSAIGSYSWIQGHPSLFLYAVLNYPIGGPAFFFVTGLAAGFGYNRALKMPAIDQVEGFPLVRLATGAGSAPPATNDQARRQVLTSVLSSLHDSIPPSNGQYFIAAGVKFTSFKLIDSFLLLSVSFGVHFEIDVLGLSSLVVPSPDVAGANAKPLAVAKLALRGSYQPEEGFIAIEARLTSDSYIFDQACHLTGGFAFYSWFDNDHAGDFVLTLGGYHPKFKVPPHYPTVPRLGVNWRISSTFTVSADFYFALTANALMAGGHLNATYQSGNIKAWFQAGADFIISWKPYFYDATFSVGLGVSVTIHFFGTHHLSFHLGADVHVWGPEFSGRARIHLSVITFTITFGSGKTVAPYISWDEFHHSFIPDAAKVCSTAVTNGKVREIDGDDGKKHFLINAKELELTINTTVPVSNASQVRADCISNNVIHHEDGKQVTMAKLGMRPVEGATSDKMHSIFEIHLTGPDTIDEFHFEPLFKKVPAALWDEPLPSADGKPAKPDLNGKRFIDNALTGFKMRPKNPPASGHSHQILKDDVAYSTHFVEDAFSFETEQTFQIQSITQTGTVKNEKDFINAHILDKNVVDTRNQLLKDLGFQPETLGLDLDSSIADVFVEMPMVGDYA